MVESWLRCRLSEESLGPTAADGVLFGLAPSPIASVYAMLMMFGAGAEWGLWSALPMSMYCNEKATLHIQYKSLILYVNVLKVKKNDEIASILSCYTYSV